MKKTTLWILSILFIIGVVVSFVFPYLLLSNVGIRWFFKFFIKFSIFVLPIFIIWLGLLLSKGNWREIKNHIRELIVFTAIFLAASFCLFKWINTINTYGVYGSYVQNAEANEEFFRVSLIDKNSTAFEKETIYREFINNRYNFEFKKMWTFSAVVFFSAFLLLAVIPKQKE